MVFLHPQNLPKSTAALLPLPSPPHAVDAAAVGSSPHFEIAITSICFLTRHFRIGAIVFAHLILPKFVTLWMLSVEVEVAAVLMMEWAGQLVN